MGVTNKPLRNWGGFYFLFFESSDTPVSHPGKKYSFFIDCSCFKKLKICGNIIPGNISFINIGSDRCRIIIHDRYNTVIKRTLVTPANL